MDLTGGTKEVLERLAGDYGACIFAARPENGESGVACYLYGEALEVMSLLGMLFSEVEKQTPELAKALLGALNMGVLRKEAIMLKNPEDVKSLFEVLDKMLEVEDDA